jgi:hypothetical protein
MSDFLCSVWEYYQHCRECTTEYWCMLSCLHWRVLGCLDKDDRVDCNKSVMCTRPLFRMSKQSIPDSFKKHISKFSSYPTENTRSIRYKDKSFNDLFVLRTIWGSRALCRQNADFFRRFYPFSQKSPDRSWGVTIPHSVGTASYFDRDKAAGVWSWPLASI